MMDCSRRKLNWASRLLAIAMLGFAPALSATPANKAAFQKHYGVFLAEELNRCTACHLPSARKNPESLEEFPHNTFGDRLRRLGEELARAGIPKTVAARLRLAAREDSDGDGIENEMELLLASNTDEATFRPTRAELARAEAKAGEFARFLASYKWEPFQRVRTPGVPDVKNAAWARNEIDAFLAARHEERGLDPRPEAAPEILLRRVYIDLIGLNPTPAERRAFLDDSRPDAYERLVDRLLDDPRHGERWGRHWMDIWRYSDWAGWSGGNQIRDSQPHIWRWRDWIVESVNEGKPYDRMVMEMLAADEFAPEDTNALRATGFLARNYKMLSREKWLEDTVKHTAQAFLGVTMGCAKCHDHLTDPISQAEYYQMRAVFEPHQVRTDRVPGELDRARDGLVRVYDVGTNRPTYFFLRGDERKPDTNRLMRPGVPQALSGNRGELAWDEVKLPKAAAFPDRREFVVKEQIAAAARDLHEAQSALDTAGGERVTEAEIALALAEARHESLLSLLRLEEFEEQGSKESDAWKQGASAVAGLQKKIAVLEGKLNLHRLRHAEAEALAKKKDVNQAREKREEAERNLVKAQKQFDEGWGIDFKPRPAETYPEQSTGRRLAFARWIASEENPLTARVAMNHVWLRHFGRGLVTTPENFGAGGNPPSHPELLDWLAAEFMARGWDMKSMHRLILNSAAYRMASTPDETNLQIDPDNINLWRMPSRRLDAELVRDNLLHVAGDLDQTMGGPEIDHEAGLTSRRRSVYLRIAAEKEVEFLRIFDGPTATECYQRHSTVMPQQALALGNSKIALAQARSLAAKLRPVEAPDAFLERAFELVLARAPTPEERQACAEFLRGNDDAQRARENFALVLLNHNDFVTIR
jgi:hypothetical protein